MDAVLVLAVLAAASMGALLAYLVLRRDDGGGVATVALEVRLQQLAESQAHAQTLLGERFQAQERAISKALEERLEAVAKRVVEGLEKNTVKADKSMTDLRERLTLIDAAQKNITELSTQVVGLQDILGNKQARGAFGEIQLQDLVASVLPPSAFELQATVGGNRRVDCLLKLPNPPGSIGVDAKFPLEGYHALREASDDAARVRAGRAFSAAILKHVRDIAEKYIVPGETADAALMFLPSEAVFAELHAHFPNAVEQSHRAKVFIVSPTTLWATLNTMRAILKDVRMREQAGLIQHEVAIMMEDVGRLDDRVGKLRRHFDQAQEDMRQIETSAGKIVRKGENIERLELTEEGDGIEAVAGGERRLLGD
jgi:DNA recombination protein RmuC